MMMVRKLDTSPWCDTYGNHSFFSVKQMFVLLALLVWCLLPLRAAFADNFVNWESPHVHPLDNTPDRTKLLAVNTGNNSLEVFDVSSAGITHRKSIPVGINPVSVRSRGNNEAWVVNHISDSVSIVDLDRGVVTHTLQTEDEPADVVFSNNSQAFVSCSQSNSVMVFNTSNPTSAPRRIAINGEDPRALAISPDGGTVYAAIFESGNASTILAGGRSSNDPGNVVDDTRGPYGGQNPPPNSGSSFSPAINSSLGGTLPRVGMIVKKNASNRWLDDNSGDWTRFISGDLSGTSLRVSGWDMPDRDVAIINTNTLGVSYQHSLMNMVMAGAVNPATGSMTVVGTDAINQIRFEPNIRSRFVSVKFASFTAGGNAVITDLNPHIPAGQETLPMATRMQSIGDPKGLVWNSSGNTAFITGLGSNNVVVVDRNGSRTSGINQIPVGQGPTGIVYDDSSNRLYVLNRFDSSISIIDANNRSEVTRTAFFDPTPNLVKRGRRVLYDTHFTSGLGQASCASCHVDAKADRLSWDLGNPAGGRKNANGVSYHPMKGPMRTTSLVGIVGSPLLHFRGDRNSLMDWSETFRDLQGLENPMPLADIQDLENLIGTIHTPPNPYRNVDNTMPNQILIPGPDGRIGDPHQENSAAGNCMPCHSQASNGRDGIVRPQTDNFSGPQPAISPSLKSMYEILGLHYNNATASNAGFGFIHDGSFDELTQGVLQNNNNMAFMLAFNGEADGDSHAGVGKQVTLSATQSATDNQLLAQLKIIADRLDIGLIAKGQINGESRGFAYTGSNVYLSDVDGERYSHAALINLSRQNSNTLTFTAVPQASAIRLGIDADNDGILNSVDSAFTLGDVREAQVRNPGFEEQVLGNNQHIANNISGWTVSSTRAGVWNVPATYFVTEAPEGSNIAFFDNAGTVSQRLQETLAANTSITLSVKVGDSSPASTQSTGWEVRLYAGSTRIAVMTNTDFDPSDSQFVEATLTLSEQELLAFSGSFGRSLSIELFDSGSTGHAYFDDVRLYIKEIGEDLISGDGGGGGTGNSAPTLTNPGNQAGIVGDDVSLQLVSNDSDGDSLTYASSDLPEGLTLNTANGIISGTLQRAQQTQSTVSVTDGRATATHQFSWGVQTQPTQDTVLGDGTDTQGQVALKQWLYFTIEAGADIDTVAVDLSGLSADVDLYVRANERPSGHVDNNGIFDCKSTSGGSASERCELSNEGQTTWHIGVYGYEASAFNLVARLQTSGVGNGNDTAIVSEQVVQGNLPQGQWHFFTIDSAADDTALQVNLSGLSTDLDIYVRAGSRPSGNVDQGGEYDCQSILGGASSESCLLPNTQALTWYIGVYSYAAGDYQLQATLLTDGGQNNEVLPLALNTELESNIAAGEWAYYSVDVPAGQNNLEVKLFGMSADADLYINQDVKPTGTVDEGGQYDCGSYLGGSSSEYCELNQAEGKRYVIGVYGYRATSYRLLASADSTQAVVTELSNGQSVAGSAALSEWTYFKLTVPASQSRLTVELNGLSADGDLYIRNGEIPSGNADTGANSDCISTLGGTSSEECVVANSADTDWYIGVYGYQAADYTLSVNADNNDRRQANKLQRVEKDGSLSADKIVVSADASIKGGGGSLGIYMLMLLSLIVFSRPIIPAIVRAT